jgi:hypothetical protein
MSNPGALDQLQQVHELNRAFLGLLQSRVRLRGPSLGLPAAAHSPLASAGGSLLEAAASFPRALFQVQVAARAAPENAGAGSELDEAEHDLCFSILFAARQTSRQSAYQARLLFGLEGADIERFRASPFAELQQLAYVPGVVQCAFCERHWFWQRLFTATRPEMRRQLTLMALQPRVAIGWPPRRPPQPTA